MRQQIVVLLRLGYRFEQIMLMTPTMVDEIMAQRDR